MISALCGIFCSPMQNIRFEMLAESSYEPIAKMAKKLKVEVKYHLMHADTWLKQLGSATEESKARIQKALDESFELALGIFEPGDYENELAEMKVFAGEKMLQNKWIETIKLIIESSGLKPSDEILGNLLMEEEGRAYDMNTHSVHQEMAEVSEFLLSAEW